MCRGRKAPPRKILIDELRAWVGDQLSPIAKPDEIRLTDNLPKTRSGKIMRRLLRAVARGEEITQDMSTLENPAILEQLRGVEPAAAKPRGTQGGEEDCKEAAKKAAKKTAKKVAKRAVNKAVKKPAKKRRQSEARLSAKRPRARGDEGCGKAHQALERQGALGSARKK